MQSEKTAVNTSTAELNTVKVIPPKIKNSNVNSIDKRVVLFEQYLGVN